VSPGFAAAIAALIVEYSVGTRIVAGLAFTVLNVCRNGIVPQSNATTSNMTTKLYFIVQSLLLSICTTKVDIDHI
jgi:hypothetical protein